MFLHYLRHTLYAASLAWIVLCSIVCLIEAETAKPAHCRADLPGCCPKVVEHVVLLHIEKTGGTSVRTFLQSAVKKKFPKSGTICNYLKHMPYQCQPSSANGGSSSCNQKNYDYYDSTIATGSHFRKGCKLTSSHHDFRIIDTIPEEQRKTTLLIVNLRDPASRAVSHYHMLKRHGDAGALNASGVVEYFTTDPLGVSISRNRMTRVMAGEFCCKDGAPAHYTGAAMYKRALARLDEFCVVGLTSRVQDTMLYVLHALGLPTDKPPKNLHYHNNAKKYQPTAPEVLKQLSDFNAHDVDLYAAARARFTDQMRALGKAGGDEGDEEAEGEGDAGVSGKAKVIDTAR